MLKSDFGDFDNSLFAPVSTVLSVTSGVSKSLVLLNRTDTTHI